jgi:heterodisulfide reductase subunit C
LFHHETIICEELFEKVQDVLNGRKRQLAYKICAKEEIPLRGFLTCIKCGKKLTGSGSTGGSGIKHFYYHCTKGCPERVKAFIINDAFSDYLKTIVFKNGIKEAYQEVIKVVIKDGSDGKKVNLKAIQAEIGKNRERLNNAQQMMLDGELSAGDYREIKKRYEPVIDKLESQLVEDNEADKELKKYLKKGLQIVKNLDLVYNSAPLAEKQHLVRSICKENLKFEKNGVRTEKLNDLISLISLFYGGHGQNKNGTTGDSSPLSHLVIPLGNHL